MKFLILGAGGVGGYFGGRLAASGADVTFVVRPKRQEQVRSKGLIIESPLGDLNVAANSVTADALKPGYDVVLLTCKAYDLDASMDAIAPAMDGKCAVLPLLNGMAHLDRLKQRFGAANVLGGSCHIAATLTKDGVVKHLNDLARIMYGELDNAQSDRIIAIDAALQKSGVEAKLSPNILLEMWEKIAFLSTLAGMTCLMRGSVGRIAATPDGAALMKRYFGVCCEVATKNGHAPRPQVVERMTGVLTDANSTLTASMLRDLDGGGPVEADHIVGYMLGKARELGLDDTLLAAAYTHLKVYEGKNKVA
jgi:2-dehydropantoate 2-reductase